jgi:hypothetical protein
VAEAGWRGGEHEHNAIVAMDSDSHPICIVVDDKLGGANLVPDYSYCTSPKKRVEVMVPVEKMVLSRCRY